VSVCHDYVTLATETFAIDNSVHMGIFVYPDTRKRRKGLEKTTAMFKALSDRTRLRIVNLLLEGELCVCEVMQVLGATQSKSSRHLTYLKNAGLVKHKRKRLWIYYSLTTPKNSVHRELLKAVRFSRKQNTLLRADLKKLPKVSRTRIC